MERHAHVWDGTYEGPSEAEQEKSDGVELIENLDRPIHKGKLGGLDFEVGVRLDLVNYTLLVRPSV
jgi:hypothetical protein